MNEFRQTERGLVAQVRKKIIVNKIHKSKQNEEIELEYSICKNNI